MTFWRMAGGKNKAAVCRVSVKLTLSEESRQKKKKKLPFSRFVCVCARVSLDKKEQKPRFVLTTRPSIPSVVIVVF